MQNLNVIVSSTACTKTGIQ